MDLNKTIDAPVVLFVYKRPNHTKKILDKINQVKPKKVYVIGDGWKCKDDKILVKKTRELISELTFKTEKLFFDTNVGLRRNVEIGLNHVFNLEEKAIVLEDDTLPSLSFFHFCDILLKKHAENKQISMITGSNFKTEMTSNHKNDYFFSKYPFIWGWATWRDRWEQLFDNKMTKWNEYKSSENFRKNFHFKRELNYWKERFNFHEKNLNFGTWDYPFHFGHFYYEKKTIVPKINLIENIGYDIPTSHNPKKTANLKTYELNFPLRHPTKYENIYNYDKFCSVGLFSKSKISQRIKNKLIKLFNLFKKKTKF